MIINKLLKNKNSQFGLIIRWNFHKKNKWVCALTPYLVKEIINEFNPIIINSQLKYNLVKSKLKYIISLEPGWGAPQLNYDTSLKCKKAVFYSDPHSRSLEKYQYFKENEFDFVFSYYKFPFFKHFKKFPKEKFVHMPWAVPKTFITNRKITVRNKDVVIFGGKASKAYDIRNWCRKQKGVIDFDNSGVENKKMTDEEYFKWLTNFDGIIAAGSSNPKYDLVSPKYFEIAASGALLFAQYCKDLETLGFNKNNCLIFKKENFRNKLNRYKKNPHKYINTRKNGRKLIKKRHTLTERINTIKEVFKLK